MRDVFRMAGNVKNCELKVDKEGKSRGMGIVEFDHPMEAVQAICILLNIYIFTPLKRSLGQDNVLETPPDRECPCKLMASTAAGGTHHTGMHSCLLIILH